MKYKALILDLDGTTVPSITTALPSVRVTDAIAKASTFLHVCLATGRPLHLAHHIIKHLKLSGPCVIDGGVQIYDPVKEIILKEIRLSNKIIPDVTRIAKRYHLKFGVYNGSKDISSTMIGKNEKVLDIYFPDVPPGMTEMLEKDLRKLEGVSVQKMNSWTKGYLSLVLTHMTATKLHGIQSLMDILNVKKEEIIGVGDSYNDFPLLMASGLKIAMGNAITELKAIADFVAPTVDDDGVATIIEKFILST